MNILNEVIELVANIVSIPLALANALWQFIKTAISG